MFGLLTGRRWLGIAGLSLLTACGASDEASGPTGIGQAPRAGTTSHASVTPGSPEHTPAKTPPEPVATARGKLLQMLPRDTLFAVRIPELAGMSDAVHGTALARAVEQLDLGAALEPARQLLAEAQGQLTRSFPAAERWLEMMSRLDGEVVFSVVHAYPALFMAPRGSVKLPLSVVLLAELGDQSDTFRDLLGGVASATGARQPTPDEYVWEDQGVILEVRFDGPIVGIRVVPSQVVEPSLADWMGLTPTQSMLAADVVRHAPRLQGDKVKVMGEVFLNLAPIWSMVEAMVPPPVQEPLDALKLTNLKGFSLCSAVAGAGFHEAVTIHSPGRQDLFTSILGASELDADWLRWVPNDSDSAGAFALDLGDAFGKVRAMLPAEGREQMDQGLASMRMMTGVDIQRDVIENLGPHFVASTRGSPYLEDSTRPFELVLAIEVKRPDAVRKWVDLLLMSSGLVSARKVHRVAGSEFYSMTLPPAMLPEQVPFPVQPAYALTENCLLVATTPVALQKAIVASRSDGKLTPESLKRAAERHDAGTIGVTFHTVASQGRNLLGTLQQVQSSMPDASAFPLPDVATVDHFAASLPDSQSWCRSVPEGIRLEARSAISDVMGMAAVGAVGIGAAVAIPNLLMARNEANEKAVVANLRSIVAAQEQFRAARVVDRDQDGLGEYGYFAELSGGLPPRGTSTLMSPPMLVPDYQSLSNGCVQRSGYLYRMDLPSRKGAPISEAATGGAPQTMDADAAETGFVVYAWPAHKGKTGERCFVVDESGEIYVSDNTGAQQSYSGFQRMPSGDAAFLSEGSNRNRGSRSVRRGQDGSLWLKETY